VWPIEERPVEKGEVPGEWYAPTQPFVTKPPAFDRQGVSIDDLIDFTPALRAEAVELVKQYKIGPLFTPPVVSTWGGPLATLMMPSSTGGPNWPGGALDPETNILYIYSFSNPSAIGMISDPSRSDMSYIQGRARDPNAPPPPPPSPGGSPAVAGEGGPSITVQGLPLIKPPYGRISAIDLNKGTIAWQVPHGDTPDVVRNAPALKGVNIPRTGRGNGRIGTLVTKTLVIAGEAGYATTEKGRGAKLRAYDKATGADAGEVFMPAPQSGSPMTYMLNGKQYLVVAISGAGYSAELVAYRTPS
jgi:quinoprotein glucose dehydrogenase